MHTHKVPIKSADAILDEFLSAQTLSKASPVQRSPTYSHENCQETNTKLKVGSPTSPRRDQNLLYSISNGNFHHGDNFEHSNRGHSNLSSSTMQLKQIQRRLISFFFFILLLSLFIIITLHLIVAAYSYYQQGATFKRSQQLVIESLSNSQQQSAGSFTPAPFTLGADVIEQDPDGAIKLQQLENNLMKLEGKLHWFERQLERLAIDHEETKNRLREREKCACSMSCSFNGTRFSDGQRWQQNCDVCTCQSGKISCVARECPKLACDDQVQLPGQCCLSCMKKCKFNTKLVRHGHTFQPNGTTGEPLGKRCTCHDGVIKCEQLEMGHVGRKFTPAQALAVGAPKTNKTLEYLKSILRNPQVQLLQKQARSL